MPRRRQINSEAGTPRLRSTVAIAAEPVRDAVWAVREGLVWRLGDLLRRAAANRPRHLRSRAVDGALELLRRVLDGVVILLGRVGDGPLGDLARRVSNSVVGDLFRRSFEILKLPFEKLTWAVERTLLWPLQERVGHRSGLAARAGLATMAVGAGVLALALVANSGSHQPARTSVDPLAAPPASVGETASAPVAPSPAPTLEGAAPDFKPPPGSHTAEASRSIPKDAAPASPPSTAGEKKAAAGPAALKVAHRFADAFVLYETGQIGNGVRAVFSETATPRLSQALLRRPPRLPANVKVPQAKVVNVVPGPRHGPTYTVSVSLLRVGITSELRVSMQRDTGGEWLVTDVLG